MKWTSHLECTSAIASDMGLQQKPMMEGCIYPDQVGMNKANKGNSVEGVNMDYPHHYGTDGRIRSLILRLRKKVLNGDEIDSFVLGCLCHLIQERAVPQYSASSYQSFFSDAVAIPAYLSRSEEHTSELQSRGLSSYAVFCLNKKKNKTKTTKTTSTSNNYFCKI